LPLFGEKLPHEFGSADRRKIERTARSMDTLFAILSGMNTPTGVPDSPTSRRSRSAAKDGGRETPRSNFTSTRS
jgi:hypothetical protein